MTTTSVGNFERLLDVSIRNCIRSKSRAGLPGSLVLAGVLIALAVTSTAVAQDTRGSISGLVVDSSGSVVPGARVTITETETHVAAAGDSQSDGLFLVAGLLPGSYTLRVEAGGFKSFEKTNLNLSAGERLEAGQIQLEVGSTTETLTVTTYGEAVQLDTSDRGDVVTTKDVENLPMAGRNWASLLNILPGAITQNDSLEPDSGNANIPIYNGVSNAFSAIYEDGISNNLQRSYQYGAGETPDVIAEVKVETSNFNAEYGGAGGGNVQLISKSGTSQFHGDLFTYIRNEAWEANDFFNVLTGSPKPVDRFMDFGGTFGGPIFWPGRFNREKNKLFFFIGQEYVPVNGPAGGLSNLTMPTAAQRNGDFSQTTTPDGTPVPILDPFSNHQPFPGNVVPKNRINPAGQALLNVFPLPNFNNASVSSNQYNYIYQPYLKSHNNYHFYRVDWDPTEKLRMFWRFDYDPVGDTGLFGANWPLLATTDNFPYIVTALDASYIFSPTMVNDFVFGMNERHESNIPNASQFAALNRTTNGVNIPQFNPQNNPYAHRPSPFRIPADRPSPSEFLSSDGAGKVYVNLMDKNEVAVVDMKARKVVARWPVAPGGAPVGMTIDTAKQRLLIGCRKPQKLIVMSTDNGKVLADLPIGGHVDAVKIDNDQIFASCADGTLAVVNETSPGKFVITQTVKTPEGARTMGVDPTTHRIYLPTAEPRTGGPEAKKPGNFVIVVVSRNAA